MINQPSTTVHIVSNFAAGPSDDKTAVVCKMTLDNGTMAAMVLSKDAAVEMAKIILNAIVLGPASS